MLNTDADSQAVPRLTAGQHAQGSGKSVKRFEARAAVVTAEHDSSERRRSARRRVVTMTEPEFDAGIPLMATVRFHVCRRLQAIAIDRIESGRQHMTWLLFGASVIILIGLAIWGITMTHKVAGPLYKVTLYFEKMKHGTFDTVYGLRKGDQLQAFYEHFKEAHAGMSGVHQADQAAIRDILAAVEGSSLAVVPSVADALTELRAVLAANAEDNDDSKKDDDRG